MFNHRRGGVTESLRLFNQCRILISEGTEIENAGGEKSTKIVSDLYCTFAFYGKKTCGRLEGRLSYAALYCCFPGICSATGTSVRANSPPSLHPIRTADWAQVS